MTNEVKSLKTEMKTVQAKSVQDILAKDKELQTMIQQLEQAKVAEEKLQAAKVTLEEKLKKRSQDVEEALSMVVKEEVEKNEALKSRRESEDSLTAAKKELTSLMTELTETREKGKSLSKQMTMSLANAKEAAVEKSNFAEKLQSQLQASNAALEKVKCENCDLKVEIEELALAVDQEQATTENEVLMKNEALKGKESAEMALKSKDSELKNVNVEMKQTRDNLVNLQSRLDQMTVEMKESTAKANDAIGLKDKEIVSLQKKVEQVLKREALLKSALKEKEVIVQKTSKLVEKASSRRLGLTSRLGKMKQELQAFSTATEDENAKLKAKLEARRKARLERASSKDGAVVGTKRTSVQKESTDGRNKSSPKP